MKASATTASKGWKIASLSTDTAKITYFDCINTSLTTRLYRRLIKIPAKEPPQRWQRRGDYSEAAFGYRQKHSDPQMDWYFESAFLNFLGIRYERLTQVIVGIRYHVVILKVETADRDSNASQATNS